MIQVAEERKSIAQVCPRCNGHTVGKISKKRYFCAECCLEFSFNSKGKAELYYSDPTGTVVKTACQSEAVG